MGSSGISPVIGREHPGLEDMEDFVSWVNQVTLARHGQMLPLRNVSVYKTLWSAEKCKKVKRMNNNLNPRRPDEPIIVLRGMKRDYLLDGNRRINTWIAEGSDELHKVWLVCPVFGEDTASDERR